MQKFVQLHLRRCSCRCNLQKWNPRYYMVFYGARTCLCPGYLHGHQFSYCGY